MATSPQLAVHSSELLSDLPSAACLLAGVLLLADELLEQPRLRWRVVWVGPLFATAFYLRYGSSASIGVIGTVMAVAGRRAIIARPLPVIVTVCTFGALLIPHLWRALTLTGSPLGILRLSAEIPGEAAGIGAYLRGPITKYGVVPSALMLIGLAGVLGDRKTRALTLIAIGQVVLLASTTQAQPRFIYLATVLLMIVGVATIRRATARFSARSLRAIVGVALAVTAACWVNEIANGFTHRDRRLAGAAATHLAASVISQDRTRPCTVVAKKDRTRLEWYSGCRAVSYRVDEGPMYEVRDGTCVELEQGARCLAIVPGVATIVRLR